MRFETGRRKDVFAAGAPLGSLQCSSHRLLSWIWKEGMKNGNGKDYE